MQQRLSVLSFVLAVLLPTTVASAQVPAGSSLTATDHYVFVLQDGILYKVDQRTMKVLGSVHLASAQMGGVAEMVEEIEMVPEVEIAEEIVEEPEIVEEVEPRRVKATSRAVDAGIEWLIRHQDDDGKWDADEFMKHDVRGVPTVGAGNPTKDVGVTGLATLALLSNGSTMRHGPHRDQIKLAVRWLRDQQQENGLIGTNTAHDFIYSHAIATFALSEAYGLSRYKMIKPTVQKAINYLESHRNPYAVWRYQPRDNDNDTSVTTWALMAYRSAQSFGLEVNGNALELIGAWYDQVTDEKGRTGYTKRGELSSRMPGDHSRRFPPENGEALTAAALYGRFLLDQDPKSNPIMGGSASLLAAKPPKWQDGHVDPYYWWFGSNAMFQMGGPHWKNWSRGLAAIARAQRRDGNYRGSWDPTGVWDIDGGRVYSTAMHALTLQIDRRNSALVR